MRLPGALQGYPGTTIESAVSAVSLWAIIGGAVAAVATTVVLVLLGAGLGFSAVSPWPNSGATAATFSIAAGIWLVIVQWLSSAIGGYITGRLRTRWVRVHVHEVFFRDTAHGFLAGSLATLIAVFVLSSAVSSAVGTATQAASTAVSGAAQGAGAASGYTVDSLFRGQKPELASTSQQSQTEATRILGNAVTAGEMPPADRIYLAQQIAQRTGISQDEAQKRVDDTIASAKAAATKAREAADTARKSAAKASIFLALSMLIGAFIASVTAAFGGSLRDEHP